MAPTFGERRADRSYIERPGAYGFIRDAAGHIAVVRLGPARHFFPGGGIESGETPVQCLLREIGEELGWRAAIGAALGNATQYAQGRDGRFWAIRAHYFMADLVEPLAGTPEHECLWLPPAEVSAIMTREADRWAIAHLLPQPD